MNKSSSLFSSTPSSKILITGLPGVGKTTLCNAFRAAGLPATDLDDTPVLKWSHAGTKEHSNSPFLWLCKNRPSWDLQALRDLLTTSETRYYFGVAPNVLRASHLFDRVIYLHVDRAVVQDRLKTSPRHSEIELQLVLKVWSVLSLAVRALAVAVPNITFLSVALAPNALQRQIVTLTS